MNYNVYISKPKVEMLYNQVTSGEEEIEYAVEGGASIGIATGKGSRKAKRTMNLNSKLEAVICGLPCIGDIHSDNEYIQGSLAMSWNIKRHINEQSNATFWIGESMGKNGIVSKILLIGSSHNVIGNNISSNYYCSTSYIDSFFNAYFEKAINYETLDYEPQCQSLNGKSSDDRTMINDILANHPTPPPEIIKDGIKDLINKGYLADYIDELWDTYYGDYCEYDFIAKFLHSELHFDEEETLTRYVVATPLYVSLCKKKGNRIVNVKGQQKYYLTPNEFEQHRKHDFMSLHMVLDDAGMKSESELFTEEMKVLYEAVGRRHGLKSKIIHRTFLESAMSIVCKYFIIR